MKKILGIVVLGLLWCNTSFALPECEGDYTKWTNCSYTWADGNKYVGEWKKGKMHGQGTHIWANGNKYVGEYKKGKMHGYGTFTSPPGHKYVGKWKNGHKHGQGTFTFADGRVEKGIWKKGERVRSTKEIATAKAEAKEDEGIAKAQSVCKKVGLTPGTDKFIDCTIKMLTEAQSKGGSQTVIVGQRKSGNIYPLHCRQMGGASAC